MAQNYTWPSVSVTATNPSVGTTGTTAPGSATLVGGENPSFNLEPLQVDSSGNLLVSVASLPAPTETPVNLNEVSGAAITLGQKASAASLPVVIASDQSTLPISAASLPLPTGAATNAELITINSTLGAPFQAGGSIGNTAFGISGSLPAGSNAIGSVSVSNFPATQPVSGTVAVSNFPATQPVSGTVAVTQSTTPWADNISQFGGATVHIGQTTSNSSIPVVLASDQSALSASTGRQAVGTPVYNIYSSSPIDTTGYVTLISSTAGPVNYIDIFDSSGQAMIFAVGGVGSEVIKTYIPPGGDQIPLFIPSGSRIAYKALTANATAGYLLMTLYF